MTGCRHGAKNTLLKNYLYLAERGGAKVYPLTTVTGIRPRADGRYEVTTERSGAWVRKHRQDVRRPRRRAGSGDDGHPEAAALHARRGQPPQPLAQARRAHPLELGGDPRGAHISAAMSTSPGASPSRRRSTRTSRPTSSRCATGGAATPWGCLTTALADGGGRSRLAHLGARSAASSGDDDAQPEHAPVVRADDRRPRHADTRQLHDLLHETRAIRSTADLEAGPRRAEPDLDPRSATTPCGALPGASAGFPPAAGTTSSTSR